MAVGMELGRQTGTRQPNTYQLQLPSGRDVESRVNIEFARTRRVGN
jgi:hypothetical protein